MNVRVFTNRPIPAALDLVRSVVASGATPLKTREIYDLAINQGSNVKVKHILRPNKVGSTPMPPHPTHPIRSMSYLRQVILPTLVRQKQIQRIHTARPMTPEELAAHKDSPKSGRRGTGRMADQGTVHEWSWKPKVVQVQNPPKKKPVYGLDVGVDEDFSHLSKRRQRTRAESIARDVEWLHELDKARMEGAKAAAKR